MADGFRSVSYPTLFAAAPAAADEVVDLTLKQGWHFSLASLLVSKQNSSPAWMTPNMVRVPKLLTPGSECNPSGGEHS
jgi:hypothetical protein